MKNITFSADERLIEAARGKAHQRRTTLNTAFREWLRHFSEDDGGGGEADVAAYRALHNRLSYVRAGQHFSRDEMNER